MSDAELVAGFRDTTLPAASFRHVEHVRVAWLYLRAGEGARFAEDLQRYAAAHGVPGKYSEAITRAWLGKIAARADAASWPEFAAANPDLMVFTPAS